LTALSNSPITISVNELPIAIVGSGFSGIAMGVRLRQAGIESFVILEKASDVGGTWRENSYPGAACDVPSHLYSFSFEPRSDWSRSFSRQSEIQEYLQHCAAKYDLLRRMRFGQRVTGGHFDAATGTWTVHVDGQPPLRARALVLANGALHVPAWPQIEGLQSFRGARFHSAEWDHDFDFQDKTVAVIGTGASAIQFVPRIARKVAMLHLFQRTPPWVVPKADRPMRDWEKRLFRIAPPLHRLYRAWIYASLELRAPMLTRSPRLMNWLGSLALRYLHAVVQDPALREKLTPRYVMGCKRILLSNDYYPALVRPNVEVVTDGIARVTREGVVTHDGHERKVDAIICGTGFALADGMLSLDLVGLEGKKLPEAMREKPEAYLGITVRDFPNLFMLMGPNTGLGHNSMIFMIEAQARYAVQAIQRLAREKLAYLHVREEVCNGFNADLAEKTRRTVWSSGCTSWYLRDGRNISLWPGSTIRYWWRTRRLRDADYERVQPTR
jgi:cation diffusion facilitator CzcD-associated flavoprotein CzcO